MRTVMGWLLAGALLTTAAAGCTATTGKTVGETVDDAKITTQVKAKLAAEKVDTLTKIDVDTTRGVVALNGVVDTASVRLRAADVARAVTGVREVVNNLQVKNP
jgi:hyperosmotically inducible periplasmic protein